MRREIRKIVEKVMAPSYRLPDGDDMASVRLRQLRQARKSKGRDYLIAHYSHVPISRTEAMIGFCCECMGYYADGLKDCEMNNCKFYRWMPYGSMARRYVRKK